MTLAKENQNHFEEYLGNNANANPGIDLTVTVLTTGFWPSYKSSDLSLPVEMVRFTGVFSWSQMFLITRVSNSFFADSFVSLLGKICLSNT